MSYAYPLHRSARQLLSAPFLTPELGGGKKPMVNPNKVNLGDNNGLLAQNEWLAQQADPDAVAVEGKTLRGSRDSDGKKTHLMSAILHKEAVVIAQKPVDRKTNEIPMFQSLLDPIDLKGKVVTADAMHTQVEHAA